MKLFKFYNKKVVIVTGSTMGIGKEIAKRILRFGGKVILTGRNAGRIEELHKELIYYKGSYVVHQGDVNNMEDNKRMVELAIKTFGKIDILINNAGMSCYGSVDKLKMEVAKEIIDTNIYGSLFPVMACLDELKKSKGFILFISSLASFQGLPGYSCYSLSKMALKPLAQSLSIELKNDHVSVGIAYVGFTENDREKRTLSPEGILVSVPKRPKLVTNSQRYTADKILHQIRRGKRKSVHSVIGKFSYRINLLFPSLTDSLLRWNYKSNQNLN